MDNEYLMYQLMLFIYKVSKRFLNQLKTATIAFIVRSNSRYRFRKIIKISIITSIIMTTIQAYQRFYLFNWFIFDRFKQKPNLE